MGNWFIGHGNDAPLLAAHEGFKVKGNEPTGDGVEDEPHAEQLALEQEATVADEPRVVDVANIDDPASFGLVGHIVGRVAGTDGNPDHVREIDLPIHEKTQCP